LHDALLVIARDALLDHTERGDTRHALQLLVASLGQALGQDCQLQAWSADGTVAWSEGLALAPAFTSVPLHRMGAVLGVLLVQGSSEAADLQVRLQPVLPVLKQLLHRSRRGPAAGGGDHADLIRAALAGADTFVWEWTLENDWLSDIGEGLAQLGYAVAEVGHTQEDWNRLIHPEDLETNHEAYLRHERGETPVYEHAYRIRAASGEWRWTQERGRIVERSASGEPLRMVGTQTDITQRRELERAHEEAAQAQAASRAKTQFLARMSHELRTPLNAVLGFAQLMEIDAAEPPRPGQQRRLKLIRQAGEHLLHMINDMLDLTRIESGGMSLNSEAVALRELVERAIELVRATADQAQVQLLLQPGAELTVQADRTRLLQVLLNLLSNAIKYNRPGGQVVVQITSGAPGRATVSVRDTGLGISEADLPLIFEPFHRGAQAAGAVDGAGIGLAVTRALVQLMGGEIQAASAPGAGSVFSVQLPLADETPCGPTQGQPPPLRSGT